MRVVMCVLDSMPHRVIGTATTPHLHAAAVAGGIAPHGGRSLPMSVTYANHAAFVTGVAPAQTGLWGNKAWIDGAFVRTWEAGPRATTLFDRCAEAGRTAMVAVGDQKLGPTMRTSAAARAWPPTVEVPPGTDTDALGYPTNRAVLEVLGGWDLGAADFLFVHLNEPDTTMHLFGPHSDEARLQYRATDDDFGALVELLRPAWDDTVLITVSDHEQEEITHPECVDLAAALAGTEAVVAHDGTGAIVTGPISAAEVVAVEGVEGVVDAAGDDGAGDGDVKLAWAEPGRMFGVGRPLAKGNHGGPRCRTQVAIVSGGHPAAAALARRIETERPGALTWAPAIVDLLGV